MGWDGFAENLEFDLKFKKMGNKDVSSQGICLSENPEARKLNYSVFIFHRSLARGNTS